MNNFEGVKPVMGLRLDADQFKTQIVQIDSTFQKCPIAHAAGIPLYVKRLFNEPRKKSNRYLIVRMMSEPSVGLAPNDWQYGGCLQPAPSVLIARSDSVQFTIDDYAVLDDFQILMLDDGPRNVKRKDFISFAKSQEYSQKPCNIILEALFPKGSKCNVQGLKSKVELNGKQGICNGIYLNDRLGVQFLDLKTSYSIRSKNLHLI